jgi:hypothetical protein
MKYIKIKDYKIHAIMCESKFDEFVLIVGCFSYICWILTTIFNLIIRIIG